MDTDELKPCPVCGQMLTAALADAVGNPEALESCPEKPKIKLTD